MTTGQRVALLFALVGGTLLRLRSLATATPSPDAFGYIDLAGQMSWTDPWRASAREPLWIAFVKVVVAALRRRDRAVVVLVGLSAATVLGYGMILPYFDRRLVSHLTPLLVLLACAGLAERRRAAVDGPVAAVDQAPEQRASRQP